MAPDALLPSHTSSWRRPTSTLAHSPLANSSELVTSEVTALLIASTRLGD